MACMTVAPAMAQTNIVYAGQTTTLSVVPVAGDNYGWELYENVTGINFATMQGNCPGTSAYFVGTNTGASVLVKWLKPGTYFYKVTAYRAGCTMNLKVGKLTVLELKATISGPGSICIGDMVILNITLPGKAPWNIDIYDGTTTTNLHIPRSPFSLNLNPPATTDYTITSVIDDNGINHTASNSLTVKVYSNPVFQLSGSDTLFLQQEIVLDAGSTFKEYLWLDGSTESQLKATTEGLYGVTVTNYNDCKASDSVMLIPCQELFWMPNAFTPNNDGLNDTFKAEYKIDVNIPFKMLIFNKWGEEIFSSKAIHKGWDGTYKGVACPQDLYTWTIIFDASGTNNCLQDSPHKGTVMLLK